MRREAVAQNRREDKLSCTDRRYPGPEGTKGESAKLDSSNCLQLERQLTKLQGF